MSSKGIGIIGTGWGVRVQVPAFRAAGLEVTALAGRDAVKTARIAADLGIGWSTGDWRALLARPDVALVSIVTPPNMHCEMAVAALEAGKHVLCEKPTAMNAGEAEHMLNVASAHPDRFALIDHELRFLPTLQLARSMIAVGKIGYLRHAEFRVISSSRADLQRPWNWWSDVTQGGGVFGAIGSHQIDTLRYLLDDEVRAAQGFLHTFVTERPIGNGAERRRVTADDFAAFQLQFDGGATATAIASTVARVDEPNSLTLYGSAGSLRFGDGRLWYAAPGDSFEEITPPHRVTFPPGISGDFPQGSVYLGHALRAALAGDRGALEPAATFADGLRVQQVLDAVRRGHTTRQP